MTIYKYSTITDGQTIVFKPLTDTLSFDVATINAADLSITESGADLIFNYNNNTKTFTLTNTALTQLANISFASGSKLIIGDNTTGILNDDKANNLVGGIKADLLYGMGGDDTLNGGGGADVLIGGNGNDIYIVDNPNDQVNEDATDPTVGGVDSVQSTVSYTLNANVENLQLYVGATIGTTNINGTGNYLNNQITGNNGNNILQGLDGDDKIIGGAGADTLDGGTGSDLLIGGNGNDTYKVDSTLDVVQETSAAGGTDTVKSSVDYTLDVNVEKLILTGDANTAIRGTGNKLSNIIVGSDGNNILNGVTGADSFNGGKGNDTYYINSTDDRVDESSVIDTATQIDLLKLQQTKFSYNPTDFSDIDMIKSTVTYTLPNKIEQLQLLGSGNINATGNTLNNVLYANIGNNIFNGVSGNDTVSYQPYQQEVPGPNSLEGAAASLGGVTVSLASIAAQNTRGSGTDTLKNIDNLIGSQYNDTLTGNAAVNILDGSAGADVLKGGDGNDSYIVDSGDVVIEINAAATQKDTVYSSVDYVLPSNVEYLTLIGAGSINGIGNALVNIIIGNEQSNTLDGGAGADNLRGGNGDDRYIVDSFDTVNEFDNGGFDTIVAANLSKTLPSNVENLQLIGTIALSGTGNGLSNIIYANSGNSSLNGGVNPAGIYDTVSYEFGANAGVTVDLNLTTIQATGGSGSDKLVGFDNVTGSVYNDILVATATSNAINGLDGLDTVSYAKVANSVMVNLAQGTASSFDSNGQAVGNDTDALVSIENVIGTNKNDTFIVNSADNVINGSAGIDTVSYEASATSVNVSLAITTAQTPAPGYYLGYDTLTNIENLIGSNFNDTLIGNTGNNLLRGSNGNSGTNDGADTLNGGAGVDTLIGDMGADILTGGAGKDTFRYINANDSHKPISDNPQIGIDTITDFHKADGDLIDLSLLLPDTVEQKQVFNFVGTGAIGNNGDLKYSFSGTNTMIEGINDGGEHFFIQLTGKINLTAADFNL